MSKIRKMYFCKAGTVYAEVLLYGTLDGVIFKGNPAKEERETVENVRRVIEVQRSGASTWRVLI